MKAKRFHYLYLLILIGALLIPVWGTLMYAIAGEWSRSILPDSWTLNWLSQIWQDDRFIKSLWSSVAICVFTALLSIVVVFPVVLAVHINHPRWEKWLNVVLVLPFTLPPVVASVGILQLYTHMLNSGLGTFIVLIGCYFTIVMPFVYRSLDNNFRSLNAKELMDASALLGASYWQSIVNVLLPNLKKGVIVAFFIAISFLMGEFVFINILAGGYFETLQVYLYTLKNSSGHLSSAVVISYFVLLLILTGVVSWLSQEKKYVTD
ncbi:ABC transporter permease [Snodgrassella sp. CFCC 13594]|uniref:ABC transporter permease n=1 Tax=Snodgrassella sp. CFCC 13594 TaxID=1775559 RepID=UPI000831F0BA|nr:ABC transporter permease subunit [Snodgrassella sp. CFCC 13594]